MAEPIKIGEFLFHEIDFALLAACSDGHRAEIWTKPDYDFVNIYLEGFETGQGKLAMLKKSINPKLVRMIDSKMVIYAEIRKNSATQFTLEFKERTEEEILASVAQARKVSEDAALQLRRAENDLKALTIQKLLTKYRPSSPSIYCALRTPAPVSFTNGDQLLLLEHSVDWYAATSVNHVMFCSIKGSKTGYVRAPADVRMRIVKAHFNGYRITATVTGVVSEVQRHGVASIWDEQECTIEIMMKA